MNTDVTQSHLIRVSDGVYGYVQDDGTWWLNNAAFVTSRNETMLFDTCATAARTDLLLDALRRTGAASPQTVVCSHGHSDHTHGLSRVSAATIIAPRRAHEEIVRRGIVRAPRGFSPFDVGPLKPQAPTEFVDTSMTRMVGNIRCELVAIQDPAHSAGDLIAWLPDSSVLFAGDLAFNGVTPLLMSGSVTGTIRALEDVLIPLDARVVIPGHGKISGKSTLHATLRYCQFVEETARRAKRRGQTALTAAKDADLGEFTHWMDPERLVANLHRSLGDQEGVPPGGRLDYPRVMTDMAEFAGMELVRTRIGDPCEVSEHVEDFSRQQLC